MAEAIEQTRMVDYLTLYLESSEPVTVDPTQAHTADISAETAQKTAQVTAKAQAQARATSSPQASAKKTIQTRRTTLGAKTVSKPALKKLKNPNGK